MRPYEMMTILAPDIPEEELDPSIDTIESYITNVNGNVVAVNQDSPWGRRRLTYPIRHQGRDVRDGFYTLWYFDAEPGSIVEIEREIRLNDRVIRHLIIALDEQVTIIPPEQREAEGGEGETPAAAEGDEAQAPAAEATGASEAPTPDAAPETPEPTEAAPAEAETASAEASVASAAAPEAAEEAAPAEADDESTTKE